MKKIALLIAISIITLSSVKAQTNNKKKIGSGSNFKEPNYPTINLNDTVKEKTTESPKPVTNPIKQPKTYTLGLQVDSAGYINIITALYTTQVNLNQSKGPHDSVSQSIEFIEEIKKLFAGQKAQQDKGVKEEKPKTP